MIRTGFWKFGLLSWCLFSGFRLDFLKALENAGNSSSKGLFIDACYDHCQTELQETWLFDDSPLLAKTVRSNFIFSISSSSIILSIILLSHFSSYSFLPFIVDFHFLLCSNSFHFFVWKTILQTIAKAVGDWYYDRTPFQKIDCPYPCNPTCHNLVTI